MLQQVEKMNAKTPIVAKNGFELAQQVIAFYQTNNPFELAAQAGVRLSYAQWHPTTWGEFDCRSASICLNTAAPIPLVEVLAHELGHYFSWREKIEGNRTAQELIAEEFVKGLKTILP